MIKNKVIFSVFFTLDTTYIGYDNTLTDIPYFLYPQTFVVDCESTDDGITSKFKLDKKEIKRILKNFLPNFDNIEDLKYLTIRFSVEKYSNNFENSKISNIYINNFMINAYRVYKHFNLC